MADQLTVTLKLKKAWWFRPAYVVGMTGYLLRLMNEDQASRYVCWLIDRGLRVVAV